MKIMENRDVVSFSQLKEQSAPSLAMRGRNKSRGLDMLVGSVASIATDAIKKVIANEQKKYIANYQFALTDLYFYDQISNDGPFDPVGMQFSGFKITRTFTNSEGEIDTAFTASFSLDTSNLYEILNNSMFQCVQPAVAVFGQKDYQQLKVITGMVRQFAMPIQVIGAPTVRAEDGLALSSRNGYLSAQERVEAVALSHALQHLASAARKPDQTLAQMEAAAADELRQRGWAPDYLTLRRRSDLMAPTDAQRCGAEPLVVLGAARLGSTRLIDNLEL